METTDQLHILVALPPNKKPLYPMVNGNVSLCGHGGEQKKFLPLLGS
jgi:hypothetical protein